MELVEINQICTKTTEAVGIGGIMRIIDTMYVQKSSTALQHLLWKGMVACCS